MKRVIEVIRVSTGPQAAPDRAGIPAQRAVISRIAAQFGLTIVETIEIVDVSGAAILFAPEMRRLLDLIQAPTIHGVVAKEFSRLMRPENLADFEILQQFANTNTLLYLPDGPIDFSTKMGRFMGILRAAMAGVERDDIRERSWSAKEVKRRRGENPQGSITLAHGVSCTKDGQWSYTPEAELVREAYRFLLAGHTSYSEIAKRTGLDRFNLPVILRNPIYCGWRVIDKKRDTSPAGLRVKPDGRQADRPKIAREPEDVIRLKVIDDPLISEEEFARAQELMDRKRARHWRARPGYESPYTYHGHLTCDDCGDLVYSYTNARGGQYYVCKAKQYPKVAGHKCQSTYMRREGLEAAIDATLGSRLADRGFLERIVEEHERRRGAPNEAASVARLEQRLKGLAGQRDRTISSFIDGVMSRVDRDARLATIDAEVSTTEALLEGLQPDPAVSLDALADISAVFLEWDFLDSASKRQILATTAPELRVADGELRAITLNLPAERQYEVNRTGTDSSQQPT